MKDRDDTDIVRYKLEELYPEFIWVYSRLSGVAVSHRFTNHNTKNNICI